MQVLIDADNVAVARIASVLAALAALAPEARLVVSGRPEALEQTPWPSGSVRLPASGWQRADMQLAEAYQPDREPLVLVTGDGDFALLAARHGGPVLVVSGAASRRLAETATVTDPALHGEGPIRAWLDSVRG